MQSGYSFIIAVILLSGGQSGIRVDGNIFLFADEKLQFTMEHSKADAAAPSAVSPHTSPPLYSTRLEIEISSSSKITVLWKAFNFDTRSFKTSNHARCRIQSSAAAHMKSNVARVYAYMPIIM